jgi:hypothetical protein
MIQTAIFDTSAWQSERRRVNCFLPDDDLNSSLSSGANFRDYTHHVEKFHVFLVILFASSSSYSTDQFQGCSRVGHADFFLNSA